MALTTETTERRIGAWPLIIAMMLMAGGGCCSRCWGQGGGNSSILNSLQVMELFDFEERQFHFEQLPMYWRKIEDRQGFPHYAYGQLDNSISRRGQYSFLLVPNGGSVAYEYHPRKIQVKPGSDFQIIAYVHFEHAINSRAQLSCVLTDRLGKPIEGSMHLSPLVGAADQEADGWAILEVYIPGNYPDARFIQPAVWVLQERQWRKELLDDQEILRKDVDLRVWFDDVQVLQLPKVILRTADPTNVFEADVPAELIVEVDGVSADDYRIHLDVTNSVDQSVFSQSWVLAGVSSQSRSRGIMLKDLPAGIYRADLQISAGTVHIAERHITFAQLAPLRQATGQTGKGFGLLALDDHVGSWPMVADLLGKCNVRLLKVPVWKRSASDSGAIFSNDFDQELIRLQENKVELVACFTEVPDALAIKLESGRRSLLDVLSRDVSLWRTEVATVLAQYARQIPFWQIGGETSGQRLLWDARVSTVLKTVRQEFEQLISNTVLAIPLNGMYEADSIQTATTAAALEIIPAITPQYIPDYIQAARQHGLTTTWVTLYPLDQTQYGREPQLIDFAKRIVYAKKGQPQGIFIEHPWQEMDYNARPVNVPEELLVVFRTLADHLGGTTYAGEFDIAPGVPAMIFSRNGTGVIVTWDSRYDPHGSEPPRSFELYLGEDITHYDMFGNSLPIETTITGQQRFSLTDCPVILNNIDSRIALVRSNFTMEPSVLDASLARQEFNVHFTNPFKTVVSGRIRFLSDENVLYGWELEPSSFNFILDSQETLVKPVSIKFPRNELGGIKQLRAQVRLDADRSYTIMVSEPFELKLEGIDVGIFTRSLNAHDLEVRLIVTNETDTPVTLISFLDLPDLDHQEQPITRLPADGIATRRFFVPNAVRWLGKYIRVGLMDPKSNKRVNYQVEIN